MKKVSFLLLLMSYSFFLSSQKELNTTLCNESIKIDGNLDEISWKNAEIAKDFIELEPESGQDAAFTSEVQVLYDDEAIYIGATLFDPSPGEIRNDLTARDEIRNGDWFFFILDTYKDGLNGLGFGLTAGGSQIDLKYINDGEEFSWDAVWESEVIITKEGWSLEMKIPYSAIRFPKSEVQEWYVNFGRYIRRTRVKSFWNQIDPDIDGFVIQSGLLKGIKEIESPLRLSLTPFVVLGQEFSEGNSSQFYGAGMDLKYGINDAFTLDMTIIPDFSQVRTDDRVNNLSPFEVQFDENRPFFTEGTELFNRGNFFYSRRIGGTPFYSNNIYDRADETDQVNLSSTSQLINATKVSGRMTSGTGIGFFNAVESREFAEIIDHEGGVNKVLANPLTNYNVLVVDQNLKHNSFVSLLNTSVLREGSGAYDANVTGTRFQVRDSSQTYEISGGAGLSQLYYSDKTDLGYAYDLNLGEIKGKITYGVNLNVESASYNPNDLGFLRSPNERTIFTEISYNEYAPKNEKLARYNNWLAFGYSAIHQPFKYNWWTIENGGFWFTSKFFGFGYNAALNPLPTHDYFEPRTSDFSRFYKRPSSITFRPFISTNYSKKLAIDIFSSIQFSNQKNRNTYSLNISPRWQMANNALIILSTEIQGLTGDEGFINKENIVDIGFLSDETDIAFGRRNRNILENGIQFQYIFTNKMFANFRLRHYWDRVNYTKLLSLEKDGNVKELNDQEVDALRNEYNSNTNFFNIDFNYQWRFAPGSDIVFTYQSNAFTSDNVINENYVTNLQNVFDNYNYHTISLKVLYFLDYYQLKNSLK